MCRQRASRGWRAGFHAKEGWGLGAPASGLSGAPRQPLSASAPLSTALKSSPSKKGRGASLAVKPLGPTAAFSASQIPSEREDAQYDLRGARSYPTLEDEGDRAGWGAGASVTGEIRGLLGKDDVPGGPRGEGTQGAPQCEERFPEAGTWMGRAWVTVTPPPSQSEIYSPLGSAAEGEVTHPITRRADTQRDEALDGVGHGVLEGPSQFPG